VNCATSLTRNEFLRVLNEFHSFSACDWLLLMSLLNSKAGPCRDLWRGRCSKYKMGHMETESWSYPLGMRDCA